MTTHHITSNHITSHHAVQQHDEASKPTPLPPTLGGDGFLLGELLHHAGGARETIAALTNANVDDELVDLDLPHGVVVLLGVSLFSFVS